MLQFANRYKVLFWFFIFLTCFTQSVRSQNNQTKNAGKKTEKTYYRNGQLEKIKRTKNGKLHGKQVEYFENGKLKSLKEFKDGVSDGKFETYSDKGQLLTSFPMKKGLKSGTHLEFNAQGQLSKTARYKIINDSLPKSVLDGKFEDYDYNGNIKNSGKYKEGKKVGLWQNYTSGVLQSAGVYEKDIQVGKHFTYYPSSVLKTEIDYMMPDSASINLKTPWFHGVYREYNEKGQLIKSGEYTRNKKSGTWLSYHNNGKLKEQSRYDENNMLRQTNTWDDKEKMTSEIYYKPVKVESGFESQKDSIERTWSDGILTSETYYKNGKPTGNSKKYNNDGILISQASYDELQGQSTLIEYFDDGVVRKRSTTSKKIEPKTSKTKEIQTSWAFQLSDDRVYTSYVYYNSLGESPYQRMDIAGKKSSEKWKFALQIDYDPDGKPILFKVLEDEQVCFGLGAFRNGKMRKLIVGDVEIPTLKQINIDENGRATRVAHYDKLPKGNLDKYLAEANVLIGQYHFSKWNHPLFTDSVRNGTYQLDFDNGKPMLRVSFNNDIIDGTLLLLDPVTQDTVVFKTFKDGILNGPYVTKFGGKFLLRKGTHKPGESEYHIEKYTVKGIPISKRFTFEDGSVQYYKYAESGALENITNKDGRIIKEFYPNGNLKVKVDSLVGKPLWATTIQYHENGNIASEGFSYNKKADSTYTKYHTDGKLKSVTLFENGQKQGLYLEYDTLNNIIQKGYYKNDLKDSIWTIVADNKIDTIRYNKNKVQLTLPLDICACVDTTHLAVPRYYPALDNILEKNTFLNAIPDVVVPQNEFFFNKLFTSDSNISTGMGRDGFATMKIVTKQKLSFSIPSSSDLTITLNPCHVEGFLTKLPISILYGIGNNGDFEFSAEPKAMEVLFNRSPMKGKDGSLYKVLVEKTKINLSSRNGISCPEDATTKICAKPGVIREILEIAPETCKLILNPKIDNYISMGLNITLAELNNFYGLSVSSGRCSVTLQSDSSSFSITGAIRQALLGTKYAFVNFEVPIKSKDQDSVVFTPSLTKQEFSYSIQQLKDYFISNGFTRVELYPKEIKDSSGKLKNTVLSITLFTE